MNFDSMSAGGSTPDCLLFGAPIEPGGAVPLCVHFQPKANAARRIHYCDLPKGRMIDLRRQ
jgi:hypothetical protein